MTLDIPSEYESVLNHLVATGAFPDAKAALKHALQLLADQQEEATTLNAYQTLQSIPKKIDIEVLARQQNVAPFNAKVSAPADLWPSDEPLEDFVAFIQESRNDVSEPGATP